MEEKIRDLFTCRNCQWGDHCPSTGGVICEYYDSLSEMEAEFEEKLYIDIEGIQFAEEWLEYLLEGGETWEN